jgi:hypothetical protein
LNIKRYEKYRIKLRIFARTPKMVADEEEPKDAKDLFGGGSLWID